MYRKFQNKNMLFYIKMLTFLYLENVSSTRIMSGIRETGIT